MRNGAPYQPISKPIYFCARTRICLFSNCSTISVWTNASFIKIKKWIECWLIEIFENTLLLNVANVSIIFCVANGHFLAAATPIAERASLNAQFQSACVCLAPGTHPYLLQSSSSEWNCNKRKYRIGRRIDRTRCNWRTIAPAMVCFTFLGVCLRFGWILEHGFICPDVYAAAPYARINNVHHVYVRNHFYRCVHGVLFLFHRKFCCRCIVYLFQIISRCALFYLSDSEVVNEVRAQ